MVQNKGFGRQRPCYTELRGYYQCHGSFSLKSVTKAFATRKNSCISKSPSQVLPQVHNFGKVGTVMCTFIEYI